MNIFRIDLVVLVLYNVIYMEKTRGQAPNEEVEGESGWGPWDSWSECTAECGTGVMSRDRQCIGGNSRFCEGKNVEFKVCNMQPCTGQQSTLRQKLCSSHDGEDMGSGRYRWQPYMINQNGCTLTCRAVGYGFYNNFPEPLTNGTICKRDESAVCVNGLCTHFGCDRLVGSYAKVDRCGVCNGDNSSCQVFTGVFEEPKLIHGYVFVKSIPAGATFINITQLSRSRNYLALKSKTGTYLINGNRRLSRQGTIKGFGTIFHYHRRRTRRCPGECIIAKGPVSEDVDIMVLTFGPNYGIQYRYAYPIKDPIEGTTPGFSGLEEAGTSDLHILNNIHLKSTVSSFISKQRTESATKEDLLPVAPTDNAIIVEDDFQGPPEITTRRDNSDQQHSKTGNEIFHSRTGRRHLPSYTQSFGFMDKMKGSKTHRHIPNPTHDRLLNPASETPLADKRQPHTNRMDRVFVVHPNESVYLTEDGTVSATRPSYRWQVAGYSSCSRECGTGYKMPIIKCMAFNKPVRNDKCQNVYPRPRRQRVPCNVHPCHNRVSARWETGGWSDCSVTCGVGEQRRNIKCVRQTPGNEAKEVGQDECLYNTKPEATRRCHKQECYRWSTGGWGECSVTCGRGFRSRSVRCMTVDNQPAQVSMCDQDSKPSVNSGCDVGECNENPTYNGRLPNSGGSTVINGGSSLGNGRSSFNVVGSSYGASWYFTQWTHGCSVACGRGTQNRKVTCLRGDGLVALDAACATTQAKPSILRDCKSRERCRAFWFTGPWGKCNVACGPGFQTRSVVCVRKDQSGTHVVVPDFNCGNDIKPEDRNVCEMSPCPPEWFMTPWSKCSVTCGTGVVTRDVKCLDTNHEVSYECDEASKPNYREECNMQTCSRSGRPTFLPPTPAPQNTQKECKDKYSHCNMVTRTTLCSHSYYKNLCCRSCRLISSP